MTLQEYFNANPKGALALSGGVDSAYLLHCAQAAGAQVQPYFAETQFQPAFERRDAAQLCSGLGLPLKVLALDVLADAQVRRNPPERCYYCKRKIFSAIAAAAEKDGYRLLWDGTNASDAVADRPGMRALQELQVQSPLRLCGLTKAQIRAGAKAAGLPVWDKPAYACLATRVQPGMRITAENLARIERAEQALFTLGFRDFRVRQRGDTALLQLPQAQLPRALEQRKALLQALRAEFSAAVLDLEARDE